MTPRVHPLGKLLRAAIGPGDYDAIAACSRYATESAYRVVADEALAHAGLVQITKLVLADGQSLEQAGRAVGGYSTRAQAVAYASGQLRAAASLMQWADTTRADEKRSVAALLRRLARQDAALERMKAALRARVEIPA